MMEWFRRRSRGYGVKLRINKIDIRKLERGDDVSYSPSCFLVELAIDLGHIKTKLSTDVWYMPLCWFGFFPEIRGLVSMAVKCFNTARVRHHCHVTVISVIVKTVLMEVTCCLFESFWIRPRFRCERTRYIFVAIVDSHSVFNWHWCTHCH